MEEKERYELTDTDCILDTERNIVVSDVCDVVANADIITDLLNQQDKRIKELEKRLAENNEFFNAFACKDFNEFKDFISTFMLAPHEEQTLIRELEQQLHDLPKKIVGEITNELSNNTSLYFEMRESTSANCPNKEYEWFNYVRFRNYINTILEKFGAENE